MWIPEKREISQADYERYKDKNSVDKELEEFVGWAARFSPWPPAGYGMIEPSVKKIDNNYYATWKRMDNCD